MNEVNEAEVKDINFEELFKEIQPEELSDNVFTLVGKVFPVITAGRGCDFNSMTASGGGLGLLFKKPTTWVILQSSRYTLELMEREKVYTISYFPDEQKKQVMFLGSKSGRDSDKMHEVKLTAIKTPSGNISYKEARLVFECSLTQVTTPGIEDFRTQEAQEYLKEAYKDENEHRKFVYGEITHVWVKK